MTTTTKTDLPGGFTAIPRKGSRDVSIHDAAGDFVGWIEPQAVAAWAGGKVEYAALIATLQAERDAAREERDQILAQAKDLEGRYIVEARSAADARLRAEAAEAKLAQMAARVEEAEHLLKITNKKSASSTKYWIKAAKAAFDGHEQSLRSRVEMAEADPVDVVLSNDAQSDQGAPPLPEDLQTASAEATAGPWVESSGTDFRAENNRLVGMTNPTDRQGLVDRKFIVLACNYIRSLLPQQTGEV